jgi:uncharacterized coiled-coil protein SlyX
MRALLGWILAVGLIASPAIARTDAAAGNTPATDSPAVAKTDASAAPANATAPAAPKEPFVKPVAKPAAKPAPSSLESELAEMRDLLESQSRQLEIQGEQLKQQQQKMAALEERLKAANPAADSSSASPAPNAGVAANAAPAPNIALAAYGSATATPVANAAAAATPAAAVNAQPIGAYPQAGAAVPDSPLQLRIGNAFITPIGFMDFTGVFRNHNAGGGIGSNFAAIPYEFATSATTVNLSNHVNENRLSIQNSRIGFRVDALVKGAHVIGYMESDFLGNNPTNVAVSSNSNTLRSRLYWIDVAKDKWEVLGGQTWSLITPGRTGISPIPGNLFVSQDIDVNYQIGLVWGRIPELRFVYHPSPKAAIALALDNQEQYWGGSAGGPTPLLPTGATVLGGVAGLPGTQLNNQTTTVNAPQLFPDVIAKVAFDPSPKFHFEFGGVERQFRVAVNSTTSTASPSVNHGLSGGGAFVNLNFQLFNGLRILTSNYWSQGGGRYIFGQVPDLIVNPDGSLSAIRTSSTLSGLEYTHKNTALYFYYGGVYVFRDVGIAGGLQYGYGVNATGPGSNYTAAISQNRTIQEATGGFNQTLWRDAKYGALNFMGQYSYLTRNPWSVALGNPTQAKLSIAFLNLRYTLPGTAPAATALK